MSADAGLRLEQSSGFGGENATEVGALLITADQRYIVARDLLLVMVTLTI